MTLEEKGTLLGEDRILSGATKKRGATEQLRRFRIPIPGPKSRDPAACHSHCGRALDTKSDGFEAPQPLPLACLTLEGGQHVFINFS